MKILIKNSFLDIKLLCGSDNCVTYHGKYGNETKTASSITELVDYFSNPIIAKEDEFMDIYND